MGADLDLDLLVIQLALAQLLAEHLAGGGAVVRFLVLFLIARRAQQGIQDAILGSIHGAVLDPGHFLLAQQRNRVLGQVADDGFNIPPDIAHLGELGCFHLDEGRFRQFGEAACDLGFAHARGADHEDVLGRDLFLDVGIRLHAPPAVAQGNGDGPLGLVLADDVAVEFVNDFPGGHACHGNSCQSLGSMTSSARLWLV